jgi:hypothetical protein
VILKRNGVLPGPFAVLIFAFILSLIYDVRKPLFFQG